MDKLTTSKQRLEEIKTLFADLTKRREWLELSDKNYSRRYDLYTKSLPIIHKLKALGVSSSYSASYYFFGFELKEEVLQKCAEKII